jgi:hypothetical protein
LRISPAAAVQWDRDTQIPADFTNFGIWQITQPVRVVWRRIEEPSAVGARIALSVVIVTFAPVTVLLALLIHGVVRDVQYDLQSLMIIGALFTSLACFVVSIVLAVALKKRGQGASAIDVLMMSPFLPTGSSA